MSIYLFERVGEVLRTRRICNLDKDVDVLVHSGGGGRVICLVASVLLYS